MVEIPKLTTNSFPFRALYTLSIVGKNIDKGVKEGAGLFRRAVIGTASLAWRATKWTAWKEVDVLPRNYAATVVNLYAHELGHLYAARALLGEDANAMLGCFTMGFPTCITHYPYPSLTKLVMKFGIEKAYHMITMAGPALEATMMILVACSSRRGSRTLFWNTAWQSLLYPVHDYNSYMSGAIGDGDYEKIYRYSPSDCAKLTAYMCLAVLCLGIRANGRDSPVISKKCLSQLKEVVTHLEKEYSVDLQNTGERTAVQEKCLSQLQEIVIHLGAHG